MNKKPVPFLKGVQRSFFRVLVIFFVLSSNSLAGTFMLPDTGQTTCYDGAGNVISPCPAPGQPLAQDGSYNINPLSYTDNGNGTVTDNNTGLMWQQQDDRNMYNWYQASGTYDATYNPTSQNVCGELTTGGYYDWRLPSKKELISIVDYSIPWPGPTINTTYFPYTDASNYWSCTTEADCPGFFAWVEGFYSGGDGPAGKDYGGGYVRCVRGEKYSAQNFTDNGNGTVTDNKAASGFSVGTPKMLWSGG
jgi:hypothetical protein